MTIPSTAEAGDAVELLASRSLIRLVTEIDDNGAIPPRRLAATLPDLSMHQLRRATETARTHGLVRTVPGAGLELTDTGCELADLYDTAARWSRSHALPSQVCGFSDRVRHVLSLLAPSLAVESSESADSLAPVSAARLPSAEAEAGLARLRALVIQWLAGSPQVTRVPEPVA
ncbi:regulator [Streptomyces sp. NPDC001858]